MELNENGDQHQTTKSSSSSGDRLEADRRPSEPLLKNTESQNERPDPSPAVVSTSQGPELLNNVGQTRPSLSHGETSHNESDSNLVRSKPSTSEVQSQGQEVSNEHRMPGCSFMEIDSMDKASQHLVEDPKKVAKRQRSPQTISSDGADTKRSKLEPLPASERKRIEHTSVLETIGRYEATQPPPKVDAGASNDLSIDDKPNASRQPTESQSATAGIFDDADEDDTFDLSILKKASSATVAPTLQVAPTETLRPDLVNAILGSTVQKSLPLNPAPPAVAKVETTAATEPKKRKASKSLRKVLIAKKELDHANDILRGKIDLTKVLPREDCLFLGKHLWIFTLQQLEAVLRAGKRVDGKTTPESEIYRELVNLLDNDVDEKNTSELSKDVEKQSPSSGKAPCSVISDPTSSEMQQDSSAASPEASKASQLPKNESEASGSDSVEARANTNGPHSVVSDPTSSEMQQDSSTAQDPQTVPTISAASPEASKASQLPKNESEASGSDSVEARANTNGPHSVVSDPTSSEMQQDSSTAQDPQTVPTISAASPEASKASQLPKNESEASGSDSVEARANTNGPHSVVSDPTSSEMQQDSSTAQDQQVLPIPATSSHVVSVAENVVKHHAVTHQKIEGWLCLIQKWHDKSTLDESVLDTTQFSLDGPVCCLVPPCTRNFLASTTFTTVHDFLSLKRTESGVVVDMYKLWRKKCNLEELGALRIAKHLTGVGLRLEAAIVNMPPTSNEAREWMGGSMVVLTGSAKDFCFGAEKIYSEDSFLEQRTKDLANQLVEWRNSMKLPLLKGTGKVAMISSWKALVKEQRDLIANDGRVLKGVDLRAGVDALMNKPEEKKPRGETTNKDGISSKKSKSQIPSDVGKTKALTATSDSLLKTVFQQDIVNLLSSAGIVTAQDLFDTRITPDSPLVRAVNQMQAKKIEANVADASKPATSEEIIRGWCHKVRRHLEDVKTSQTPKAAPKVPQKEKPKVIRQVSSVKKAPTDPYDALSATSKAFLETIEIDSAVGFLAAKTTDLANAFVKYREERGMPVLKGLGAVASISGWKALVRKAAKEVGKDELVTLNAGKNAGMKLNRKRKQKPEEKKMEEPPIKRNGPVAKSGIEEVFDSSLSKGQETKNFYVKGAANIFGFELSVRQGPALFLTYIGNKTIEKEPNVSDTSGGKRSGTKSIGKRVLENVNRPNEWESCSRAPFCSDMGLIELGQYGVDESSQNVDLTDIQGRIKSFVLCQRADSGFERRGIAYNIFERRKSGHSEFFLFLQEPIEVGQTVALKFLPLFAEASTDEDASAELRHRIVRDLTLLSLKELRVLLDYMNDNIGNDLYPKLDDQHQNVLMQMPSGEAEVAFVSRRRMQWVALRINARLKEEFVKVGLGSNMAAVLPPASRRPLLTTALITRLSQHSAFTSILTECKKEFDAEFGLLDFERALLPRRSWCPLAEKMTKALQTDLLRFSAERTNYCSEDELVQIVCSQISGAVEEVINIVTSKRAEELVDILLKFEKSSMSETGTLPCIPRFQIFSSDDKFINVLATVVPEGYTEKFDVRWYIDKQFLAVAEGLIMSWMKNVDLSTSVFDDIGSKLRTAAAAAGRHRYEVISEVEPEPLPVRTPPFLIASQGHCVYLPNAEPIFLDMVWPVLKKLRWTLEAGSVTSDVVFYLPGKNNRNKEKHPSKPKRDRRLRHKVAQETTELRLGYIPKAVKRLYINCVDEKAIRAGENIPSVLHILQKFKASVEDGPTSPQSDRLKKVKQGIFLAFEEFFEDSAPRLIYGTETEVIKKPEGKRWTEVLSSVILVRLLLVVPGMLNQSDIPMRHLQDTVGVIHELLKFMVENQQECLPEYLRLPLAEYENDSEFPDFLVPRLIQEQSRQTKGDQPGDVSPISKEVLEASDRVGLTDFFVTVMSQLIICRANREDMNRKGRRGFVQIGRPGLVCRHCLGKNGEGKYFFSNISSLGTAATSIEKHILRCPNITDDIKRKTVATRAIHQEQQRAVPAGGQSAYFQRLWDRLQTSRISPGVEADMYVTISSDPAPKEEDNSDDSSDEFGSFGLDDITKIMTYVQNESPWKDNNELKKAVNKYYECLKWGGRVCHTSTAPAVFNSEWLLSKIGSQLK